MASDLFNQINNFNPNQFMQNLNELKNKGGDPNQVIQQLLNTGRVSQAQVNQAMQRANQIMQMLAPSARR